MADQGKLRVLLVDDHALVRAGIRSLLERLDEVAAIDEAGSGAQAIEKTCCFRPDVVLMDIGMKGMSGLEATVRIRAGFPATRVLMLSMFSSEEHVLQALRIGAAGYLLKDCAASELAVALRCVQRNELYLSPPISRHMEACLARGRPVDSPLDALTPRQREILALIAEGMTTKEIAVHLRLSPKTVETHRTQLMDRLDIHDLAGLTRFAVRTGVVIDDIDWAKA